MKKRIYVKTVRIEAKTLQSYEKTKTSWKKSKKGFPEINRIVKLFKANKNFKVIVDTKDARWIKGQLGPKGEVQGARINVLPDGKVLDKAYSLFAKNLTIHDEYSDDHWDVIYQNKGGTFAYGYTLEKKDRNRNQKYKKVYEFDRVYEKLSRSVCSALRNENDFLALPMYTLLKTYMRMGNEIYYNERGHKGLSTLKKKNVKIQGESVKFDYVGKDGVPNTILLKFPPTYVQRLKKIVLKLKPSSFIFANPETGRPFTEQHFKKAFFQYCGKEFYPHIVRSHYATMEVKKFLCNKRKATKQEANDLLISIAKKLGHKKFAKGEWKNSSTVTANHYIEPRLVQRLKAITR